MIDDAAAKSPLASEPFLVRGVQNQVTGDEENAKRAFLAAQWRDPRSIPAAYFLANYYFLKGDALDGLKQTSLLARLSPSVTTAIIPFVASYAQDPANWPQMRALFRTQEDLEDGVLMALAIDPRNTKAILAIADGNHRAPDSPWLPILLRSLVSSGNFTQARAIWSSIGRGNAGSALLYDPGFSSPDAPPPFNWSVASSTVGLAERQPGKGLHLIFYGNEDGVLASELLILPPGKYHLQMPLIGSPVHPESIRWSIRCVKATEPFASLAVDQVAARGWIFDVPPNCPAQWLELSGRSGDVSQQADVTIGPVRLVRAGANA